MLCFVKYNFYQEFGVITNDRWTLEHSIVEILCLTRTYLEGSERFCVNMQYVFFKLLGLATRF